MPAPRPFRLGVTGGIASGKSSVMEILADMGVETIDADRVYHGLIEPGRPLFHALVERWGKRILAVDGSIDRGALGGIVFSDPDELAALDRLTHPAIRAEIDNLYNVSKSNVVAIDAVKLIESGQADRCDAVWLVVAEPSLQIERLVRARGLSVKDATQRVGAQPPLEARLARVDVAIHNNGSRTELRERVVVEWQQLRGQQNNGPAPKTTTIRSHSN